MFNLSYQPLFVLICVSSDPRKGGNRPKVVKCNKSKYRCNILQFNTCMKYQNC